MIKAFLETTALIELSFADRSTKAVIKGHIPPGATLVTSQYCVYEVYRGYLRYLRLLYNKGSQLKRFHELFIFLGKIHRQPSYVGALTGSFNYYFQCEHPSLSQEARLAHFRGFLRKQIRRGFRKVRRVADTIINDIGCREVGDPYEDENGLYQQDLEMHLCGKHERCGLKSYAYAHRSDLTGIRVHLDDLPNKDNETILRIEALRELYWMEKRNFPSGACFRSSDALIAHESPASATILTKNKKHFEALLQLLGKNGAYYG
jgi:hypothetical protein